MAPRSKFAQHIYYPLATSPSLHLVPHNLIMYYDPNGASPTKGTHSLLLTSWIISTIPFAHVSFALD